MKNVYYVVFMYRGKIYCKIGEGAVSRINTFRRQSPFEVQILDFAVFPVAGIARNVERRIHRFYEQVPSLLPNTTEIFVVNDLQQLRTRILREIEREEARCVKGNKHAPRFLQISPDTDTIDVIANHAVKNAPHSILLLDDRSGEIKRSLVAHDYPIGRIWTLDTSAGYPDATDAMKFDLVIMNPPFTQGNNKYYWKTFVKKAQELLIANGEIIAVLPENEYKFQETLCSGIVFDNATKNGRVVVIKKDTLMTLELCREYTAKDILKDFGVTAKRRPNGKAFVKCFGDPVEKVAIRCNANHANTTLTYDASPMEKRNMLISADSDLTALAAAIVSDASYGNAFTLTTLYRILATLQDNGD